MTAEVAPDGRRGRCATRRGRGKTEQIARGRRGPCVVFDGTDVPSSSQPNPARRRSRGVRTSGQAATTGKRRTRPPDAAEGYRDTPPSTALRHETPILDSDDTGRGVDTEHAGPRVTSLEPRGEIARVGRMATGASTS